MIVYVWIAEHSGYDMDGFNGVFYNERAALAFLEFEHEKAVKIGMIMEDYNKTNYPNYADGWWLPTPIVGGCCKWYFDKTRGGEGHGRLTVFKTKLLTEEDVDAANR